jgi:DNA gyrase inhibitor GyrI
VNIKLVKLEKMIIAGFSVETTLENSNRDIGKLYDDFVNNGKMELLFNVTKNNSEYYGIMWYTELHKRYIYLLGQKIDKPIDQKNMEIKQIPEGEYCFSKFPQGYDTIKAWTDFYNKEIPEIGYKPIEKNDIAFEYYPHGFDGEYELWSLVERMA